MRPNATGVTVAALVTPGEALLPLGDALLPLAESLTMSWPPRGSVSPPGAGPGAVAASDCTHGEEGSVNDLTRTDSAVGMTRSFGARRRASPMPCGRAPSDSWLPVRLGPTPPPLFATPLSLLPSRLRIIVTRPLSDALQPPRQGSALSGCKQAAAAAASSSAYSRAKLDFSRCLLLFPLPGDLHRAPRAASGEETPKG